MDTCAVILNPISGTSRGRLTAEAAGVLLRECGYDAEIKVTDRAGAASELAAEAAEKHGLVVVAGGDGTVSEVAAALAGGAAAMAVLPTGSGNDFAEGIGIPSVKIGLEVIAGGHERRFDLGEFAGRPFVNSCGLFLNGEVSLRAAKVSRIWGRFRYPIATLPLLGRYCGPSAHWHFDTSAGAPESLDGEWTLAEIGNGSQCGGGFRLTPLADPGDGLLDFCLVRTMPLLELLQTLPKGVKGTHLESPHVVYPRAAAAELECEVPIAVHWDGEADRLPPGRHGFRLRPAALRMIVPPPGSEG